MILNGNAQLNGSALQLTNGGQDEAGSAFYATPVNIQAFTTDFTFQLSNPSADGMTFTIQNVGTGALGGAGGSLGYDGIGESVAIKFDLYSNAGEGPDSTGLYTDGAAPNVPAINLSSTGINLHSGAPMAVDIAYNGTNLSLKITDTVTLATWSDTFAVNIPAIVGGDTAYVGFTGGTGGLTSSQQVTFWTYAAGLTPISFAQMASATPQSPTDSVSVSYPAAQTLGDLNVVVVGWDDTVSTVQSVKDSAGNTYRLAIGPTSGTGLRQSIYYAANIAGGSNKVTVTFSQAAASPDVRILEYRGVTALDVTAGASGSSTSASSGAATTTSANELIFGADYVATLTGAAGSGFTSRIITTPDGDIAEDKVVTTVGSNNATASLTSAGPWVMQMVTFSAAPGPAPTVSSVSPNHGLAVGGTAVTITGTNFAPGATVT